MSESKNSCYDNATTRNLTVIYGFYFVLFSALLSASIQLGTEDWNARVIIFGMAWFMAFTSFYVGAGLFFMLGRMDSLARMGLFVLVSFLPIAYLKVIGGLVLKEATVFVDFGVVLLIATTVIIALVQYIVRMRNRR